MQNIVVGHTSAPRRPTGIRRSPVQQNPNPANTPNTPSQISVDPPSNTVLDNPLNNMISVVIGQRMPTLRPTIPALRSNQTATAPYNVDEMIEKVRQIRRRSLSDRARALFMEIDQLGHYTQMSWFMALNRYECLRYFRCLRDIWMYRAQLSLDIKTRICPLWDPFIAVTYDQVNYTELSEQHLRTLCISVMEDMVLTGVDNEYRTLGSFHVLSALTVVSLQARNNMMWLYESLAY
jgi:hypothetical protein